MCAALGLIIVLTASGLLIYKGWVLERRRPEFDAATTEITHCGDLYAVHAEIWNLGGHTVAKLQVTAESRMDSSNDNAVREQCDATLDFLPGDSKRIATFLFRHEPQRKSLHYHFVSYQEP